MKDYKYLKMMLILLLVIKVHGADVTFIKEPHDITVYEGEDVFIPCDYTGILSTPSWIITTPNGNHMDTPSSWLPWKHVYNGSGIIINNVDLKLNMTTYKCILFIASEDFQRVLNFTSTAGVLTVKPLPEHSLMIIVLALVLIVLNYGGCYGVNLFLDTTAKFEFIDFTKIKLEYRINKHQKNILYRYLKLK